MVKGLKHTQQTRALAALILMEVLPYKGYKDNLRSLTDVLAQVKQQADDPALLQEICFGVCRWYPVLEEVAAKYINKQPKGKDGDIYFLILIGIYQLCYCRVASHAAISETVEATKLLDKTWASKFVNACLRAVQREKEQVQTNIDLVLEKQFAHPQWLFGKLKKQWPDHWQDILEQNNTPGPMTLRVNSQQGTLQEYLAALDVAGIAAQKCMYSGSGITLDSPVGVDKLPGFSEGLASVQDEAAQLASATLLSGLADVMPEGPLRVLDACAAPGGKTAHLLESLGDRLREGYHGNQEPGLTAIDISDARLERVEENLERLGLEAIVSAVDAQDVEAWWDEKCFDAILLDAPCSATGVIRRHPDIKWLRKPEDIKALAELQLQILKSLWVTLKPGGLMLYATCSILRDENDKVVEAFVEGQANAKVRIVDAMWGLRTDMGRQLFPQKHGHDGFYMSLLQKEFFQEEVMK